MSPRPPRDRSKVARGCSTAPARPTELGRAFITSRRRGNKFREKEERKKEKKCKVSGGKEEEEGKGIFGGNVCFFAHALALSRTAARFVDLAIFSVYLGIRRK